MASNSSPNPPFANTPDFLNDMKPQFFLLASALTLGTAIASLPAQAKHSAIAPVQLAQSLVPEQTYMTRQGPNTITIQITDGRFFFRDDMHRGYGNFYQAVDHGVRVNYDGDTDRVVVISDETGAEFYNYFYTGTVGSGSSSSDYDDYTTGPPSVNNITRVNDDEYAVELGEGQFYFNEPLYRSSGETFVGANGRFRVIYDRGNLRMVVINVVTGEELFNYIYSEVDEGYL